MASWSAYCPACVETPLPTICLPCDPRFHTMGKKKEERMEVGLIWRKKMGPAGFCSRCRGNRSRPGASGPAWPQTLATLCPLWRASSGVRSTTLGEALRSQLLTRAGLLSSGVELSRWTASLGSGDMLAVM